MYTVFWLDILKGREKSEGIGVDGKVVLGWIFGKWLCKLLN